MLLGIVKSEKTMVKFAESAIKYLRKHKFDGLDLGEQLTQEINQKKTRFSLLSQILNTPVRIYRWTEHFAYFNIRRIGVDWRDSPKEDKQKFTRMCEVRMVLRNSEIFKFYAQILYEMFEKEAEKTGNERLLLTAAVAAAKINIDKAYEVDKLVP